ncbi:MAG: hypothetical protein EBX66_03585 [Betaproteobacteria bacterium]|nr:hypothetical protein [Betaproteobacteria bacterium]
MLASLNKKSERSSLRKDSYVRYDNACIVTLRASWHAGAPTIGEFRVDRNDGVIPLMTTKEYPMRKSTLLFSGSLMLTCLGALAPAVQAQQGTTLTGNAAMVSDYRYRGISQTRFGPALQVGADLVHGSGAYAGAWATNIKWIKDFGVDGGIELDLYGGYKTEIAKDISVDVGALRYQYGGNKLGSVKGYTDANTTELYAALSYGVATLKLSRAMTDLFGNLGPKGQSSKGSTYIDLSATLDVGAGISFTPHLGRQNVENVPDASYTDYSFTLNKEYSGVVFGLSLVGTDASESFYVPGPAAKSSQFLGKTGLVISAKYNF